MSHDKDVLISAATASGKTEAAFLPACTYIKQEDKTGVRILYISPLKALINDQYRRLESLCEKINVPLTPWHGDVLQSLKSRHKNNPGILLITPESMEARLMKEPGWCKQQFAALDYIIIDEFHYFLGNERGYQLLSQLERIEFLVERQIPRIALSATFSKMEQVAECLRSQKNFPCEIIESKSQEMKILLQVKGYQRGKHLIDEEQGEEGGFYEDEEIPDKVTADMFKLLRKKFNLVFATSRRNVETLTDKLTQYCEYKSVPDEFFPHHGNLDKEIREDLEERLQKGDKPTTAIATSTLELGIDIGSVDSVAQLGVAPAVSSMRQRLGRSGRRGDPAVFRVFTVEEEEPTRIADRLRIDTVQSVAMINLMLEKWCEPPPQDQYQFSTLSQQTLSVIAQYGSVRAEQLWKLLCKRGPFKLIDEKLYVEFLNALVKNQFIQRVKTGAIMIGSKGEKLVNSWEFFAAFKTAEEYSILRKDGKRLGTIPIKNLLLQDQTIIFAGKRWLVAEVQEEKKIVIVTKAPAGRVPIFGGDGFDVHGKIREEMFKIYSQRMSFNYLDETSQQLLADGIKTFHDLSLTEKRIISSDKNTYVIPWGDDKVVQTLAVLLKAEWQREKQAHKEDKEKPSPKESQCIKGMIVRIPKEEKEARKLLAKIFSGPKPTWQEFSEQLISCYDGKYDGTLSDHLRAMGYVRKKFDIDLTWKKMQEIL